MFPRAGFLALGSSYRPRLPILHGQWLVAAFVPDHSGGSASDSNGISLSNPLEPMSSSYLTRIPGEVNGISAGRIHDLGRTTSYRGSGRVRFRRSDALVSLEIVEDA